MGKPSRDKGKRGELEVVHFLEERGLLARRVPLSGAAEGFGGDVVLFKQDGRDPAYAAPTARLEVKRRKDGQKQLYKWLGDKNYALWTRSDRGEWLVTMRADEWVRLIKPNGGDTTD